MCKISILVPIYNVEKYLQKCLDSLINQTLEDIEIICINDGSTDSSSLILEKYSKKDSRIKVINKENSGYGASMNLGLDSAKGEFIGIVESDDFVKDTMFEKLYKIAQKNCADIVKSDYFYYSTVKNQARKAGKISKRISGKVINIKNYLKILKRQPSIWSAIYRTDFIKDNKIRFLETPGASYQDTSFFFKTMTLAKRIVLTDKAYLYYRQDNEASSVHSKEKVFMVCKEYEEITKFLETHSDIKDLVNTTKFIKEYNTFMWNLKRIDEIFVDDFIKVFSETFKKYYLSNEISQDFYKKIHKNEFELLINNKEGFKEYTKKIIEQEKNKTERRKNFSVRINSSRISVVLFGKQLLELG